MIDERSFMVFKNMSELKSDEPVNLNSDFHKNISMANEDIQAILQALCQVISDQRILIKIDEISDWE